MRRSADVEFSELIKLNVNLVLRTSFALGLNLLCLWTISKASHHGTQSA